MKVKKIITGDLKENCYLLEKNKNCLLIDPGDDYEQIIQAIQDKNIIAILVTHHHFDHTASIEKLVKEFSYPVYDYNNLKLGTNTIGEFNFEVIQTPGHTKDSISFYFKEEQKIFTGDFLFFDTIGRTDFEDSNEVSMEESLEKIKKYPDETEIYPGHGISSILKREKQYNIFLK